MLVLFLTKPAEEQHQSHMYNITLFVSVNEFSRTADVFRAGQRLVPGLSGCVGLY